MGAFSSLTRDKNYLNKIFTPNKANIQPDQLYFAIILEKRNIMSPFATKWMPQNLHKKQVLNILDTEFQIVIIMV